MRRPIVSGNSGKESDVANQPLPDLAAFAAEHGLTCIGVAGLDALRAREPEAMASAPSGFPLGIAFGVRLPDAAIDEIENRPTPLYFHLYRQANFALDRAAFHLALRLQRAGYRALPVPASQLLDPTGRRGLVSHRLIGHAAGLGWIGRPTLLVHPDFGARVRYASVLTNAPYPPGRPLDSDCGDCRACVDACPAGAVKESSREFDVGACHAKLSEFRRLPGIGQHICGICIKMCRGNHCV